MWPKIQHLLSDEQIDNFHKVFLPRLLLFIKNEKLDESFTESFNTVYLPLAKWIESRHSLKPLIIGVNGAQGSGKSTLCRLLALILETLFNKSVMHLSIDDLYMSRSSRLLLANEVHPLLSVRGVPGTHNVKLGVEILESIKTKSKGKIKLPVFNKAEDDLLPEEQWPYMNEIPDIVLFEGWCVGAKHQSETEISDPINLLEEKKDVDGRWRRYINNQLSEQYEDLFSYIDHLIMLKVPDMNSVFNWRCLQESKLKQSNINKPHIMSDADIQQFIMYFERITMQCLKEMPERADVVLSLNKQHRINKVFTR